MLLLPRRNGTLTIWPAILCGIVFTLGLPGNAYAVPSFARQTGLACEACHTVFPQLTPFGRVFKASGYTLSNTSKVQDIDRIKHYSLQIQDFRRLSTMIGFLYSYLTPSSHI